MKRKKIYRPWLLFSSFLLLSLVILLIIINLNNVDHYIKSINLGIIGIIFGINQLIRFCLNKKDVNLDKIITIINILLILVFFGIFLEYPYGFIKDIFFYDNWLLINIAGSFIFFGFLYELKKLVNFDVPFIDSHKLLKIFHKAGL
jgi:hypothetical protein